METLLINLTDLASLLGLKLKVLRNRLRKTGKTEGYLEIAGKVIPLHKVGVGWFAWRADLPQIEIEQEEQEAKPAIVRRSQRKAGGLFIDFSKSGRRG